MENLLAAHQTSVDTFADLFGRIEAFSLDVPTHGLVFSERLAKENGWSPSFTRRAIIEYKRFLYLSVTCSHVVCPSDAVDQVWHMHLTYTRSYWDDLCHKVLGKPLHHGPTQGGNTEHEKYFRLYERTLESYCDKFGCQPPRDIWPTPQQRFGEDLGFVRINHHQHWIIPKPRWSRAVYGAASAMLIVPLAQLAMNPLDWTGPNFLALYAGLSVLAILVSWMGRAWLINSADNYRFTPGSADAIGPIDVAWMQGGASRAVECALVELVQKEAIAMDEDRITAGKNVDRTVGDHRVSQLILSSIASSPMGRAFRVVCRDANVGLEGVRQDLIDKGLVLDRSQRTAAVAFPLALLGALLALGIAKAVVGAGRGRPIDILLFAMIATAVVMIIFVVTVPRLTSAGKRLLVELHRKSRMAPQELLPKGESQAPDQSPAFNNAALLWSTAFVGAAALSSTPFADWGGFLTRQRSVSSSSTGGCGTSGCGGDGGGGGGCGGGGCGGCGGS